MYQPRAWKRSTRLPTPSPNARLREGGSTIARRGLYFRIAHGRRQLHRERVSDIVRGTRRGELSRDVREGVCDAVLAPHAQSCSALFALRACRSLALLLDVRPGGVVYRQRNYHRSHAAHASRRRSARDAVAGLRPGALRDRMELFARRSNTSRRPRAESAALTSVTLRVGDTGASSTWGIGARAADVLRVRGLHVALAFEVWRQPELLADHTSDAQHVGGGAVGTVILPLPRCCARMVRRHPDLRRDTRLKASCRASSSRAERFFARASPSAGSVSTGTRSTKVDTMSAR